MAARKWTITEVAPISNGTRVFRVRRFGATWGGTDVWLYGDVPRCCACSSKMTAMLTTCVHAAAVRRHLKKGVRREDDRNAVG